MKKRTLMLLTLSAVLMFGCSSTTGSTNNDGGSTSGNNGGTTSGGGSTSSNDGGTTSGGGSTTTTPETTYYTVTIYNADGTVYKSESVAEGSTYSEPDDSFVGNTNMIRGWYLDRSLTTSASFPMTITSNVSLYPDVITNEQYFLEARERTVNSNYEYDDYLHIQLSTLAGLIAFNGNRTGEIKARPTASFSYLAHYESSGSLLIDGEQYIMHEDGVRSNITLNQSGELTSYNTEPTTEADDNSVYAKAIFEYDDDDIEALTKVETNKYQITTTLNATSVITSTLNVLGNSYVQSFIEGLPSVSSSFTMYVTYNNGYIDTYIYEFSTTVSGITLSFTYSLDFTTYSATSSLSAPSINNLYLSPTQVNSVTGSLQTDINNYKNQTVSKYRYELAIDLENTDATYSADVSGTATRKIENETVYFNNYIETNTSGYTGVEDYERNRVNLADESVYSCYETGSLWWKNQYYNNSTYRGEVDDYYLLIGSDLLSSTYLSAGQYLDNKTTYNFVFNESGVDYMFSLFNTHVYLNEGNNDVKVMGTYDLSTLSISETQLQLVYSSSALSGINISMSGYIDTTIDQLLEDVEFNIDYSVTVQSIADYEIPTETDDIEID